MNIILSNNNNPLHARLKQGSDFNGTKGNMPLDFTSDNLTSNTGVPPADKVYIGNGAGVAIPLVKSLANGFFLDRFKNNIYLNSVRASVLGGIGLRAPISQFSNTNSSRDCKICGVPVQLKIAAWDLDNYEMWEKEKGSGVFYKNPTYHTFWDLDYPLTEYDIYEPINETINPAYIFNGKERVAKNYKVGIVLRDSISWDSTPNLQIESPTASLSINYDSYGIPEDMLDRWLSLRISLDVNYILPDRE